MTTKTMTKTEDRGRAVYRVPRVNIIETPESYVIEAEMPGVPGDAFDVHIEDRTLTVTGERPQPEGRPLSDYRVDGYRRTFNLGDTIDPERLEAGARNGILTLTLPKVAERVPRRIPVSMN